MNLVLYSDKIDEYLKHDDVIDYENEAIAELADTLSQKTDSEIDYIKATYEIDMLIGNFEFVKEITYDLHQSYNGRY